MSSLKCTKSKYPRIGSLLSRELARLLRGKILNSLDNELNNGSQRLAARIHDLRNRNWPIEAKKVVHTTLDPLNRNAELTEYQLTETGIHTAGEEGQDYANEVLGWERRKKEELAKAATKASLESRTH